jgi:hypothetical protein
MSFDSSGPVAMRWMMECMVLARSGVGAFISGS